MMAFFRKSDNTEDFPIFSLGTGRCGTHLLQRLMDEVKGVDPHHILDLNGDSFFRYCSWNGLPVDHTPLISYRKELIRKAGQGGKVYFEANPYLSFHVNALREELGGKFLQIVRDPIDVVESHLRKGWYEEDYLHGPSDKAIGYQYGMKMNHFLGRIVPKEEEEFTRWKAMSRVGKLAWMWNTVNVRILADLQKLDDPSYSVLKIEDLDHTRFQEILGFLMENSRGLSLKRFRKVKDSRPGKGAKKELAAWGSKEKEEFLRETEEGRDLFRYQKPF